MRSEYTPSELRILWRIVQRTVFIRMPLATAPGECWLSTYSRGKGYARIGVGTRVFYVHRAAYEIAVGSIPESLTLDHLCRIRSCWRPAHLEPVTLAENIRRGMSPTAINARKTHCPRGHAFTPENTYITRKRGNRACRICTRVKSFLLTPVA